MRDAESLPEDFIDDLHKAIGLRVKQAREEKGLTQLQLSQLIGHSSVSIISRAEIYYRKQRFNIEHLVKIAYVLEMNFKEFFPEMKV